MISQDHVHFYFDNLLPALLNMSFVCTCVCVCGCGCVYPSVYVNYTAGETVGSSHTPIILLTVQPLHLSSGQVWSIWRLFLRTAGLLPLHRFSTRCRDEGYRKSMDYVVLPLSKHLISYFLSPSSPQIYHEAPSASRSGAAPGGKWERCRKDPVQEDQEGAGQSAAQRWHQRPVWLLLPEERRVLSRQRRPVHGPLPGHHLLLRPLLQPHGLWLLPWLLGSLSGHRATFHR